MRLPGALGESCTDAEPFELDALQRYSLEEESTFGPGGPGENATRRRQRWQAEGRLPLGDPGRADQADVELFARWIRGKVESRLQGIARVPTSIDLQLGRFRVTGTMSVTTGGGVISWRAGKLRARYRLQAWVQHLISQVAGHAGVSLLMGEGDDTDKETKLPAFRCLAYQKVEKPDGSGEDAKDILLALLESYWEGLRRPLPFFPESSMALARCLRGGGDDAKALKLGRVKWAGSRFVPGEGEDLHIAYCFRGLEDPLDQAFIEWSRRLIFPLLDHEQEQ